MKNLTLIDYKPLDLRLTEALRAYLKSHEIRDRIKFFLDHAEGT